MHHCIYTKMPFEKASGEHILQNFLGARWISDQISSDAAQTEFGQGIDVALENGLKEIRNLFGTRGGRGGEGPDLKNIQGTAGTKYTVMPGGRPKISEPVVKTQELPDGSHKVQVTLGDMKQLGWAIAKLKQSFPETKFNIEELKSHAVKQTGHVNEQLKLQTGLGGKDFFRGALKSVFNLLGVSNSQIALLPILDDVRDFILKGNGDPSTFVRWLLTDEAIDIPKLGECDHFIAVFSREGNIDAYFQFFGEIGFLGRLASHYQGQDFIFSYLVDPFRESEPAEIRNPAVNKNNIPLFSSGSESPGKAVWQVYGTRVSRILDRYYSRSDTNNISRIVDEVLLPHDGEPITHEMVGDLSQRLAEYIVHRMGFNSRK